MSKNQQQVEKEAQEQAATNVSQDSVEAPAGYVPLSQSEPAADGLDAILEAASEAPAQTAPTGIPTAEEIRMSHHPEPQTSPEVWISATRDQIGNYLRENAQSLNEGTELEFSYRSEDHGNRILWMTHYLKFQHELQQAGYTVFMIGMADNPHLRIRLADGRKVVAE